MPSTERPQFPSNSFIRAGLEKYRQPEETPRDTFTRLLEASSQKAIAKEFGIYSRTVRRAVMEIELSAMGEKPGLPTDDRTREEVLNRRIIEARYQGPKSKRLSFAQLAKEFAEKGGKIRSRQAIHQMEKKAIKILKEELNEQLESGPNDGIL